MGCFNEKGGVGVFFLYLVGDLSLCFGFCFGFGFFGGKFVGFGVWVEGFDEVFGVGFEYCGYDIDVLGLEVGFVG